MKFWRFVCLRFFQNKQGQYSPILPGEHGNIEKHVSCKQTKILSNLPNHLRLSNVKRTVMTKYDIFKV